MKIVFIFCGFISTVFPQQKPFNSKCLNDPTINPELCMKSFSNILADANRLKPKQNPGLSKLSPYLSDDADEMIQLIGENSDRNVQSMDLKQILEQINKLDEKSKENVNVFGLNPNNRVLTKMANFDTEVLPNMGNLEGKIIKKEKRFNNYHKIPNENGSKRVRNPQIFPLNNREVVFDVLKRAMTQLGMPNEEIDSKISEIKFKSDLADKKIESTTMKIVNYEKFWVENKENLNNNLTKFKELNKIVDRLETVIKSALKISKKKLKRNQKLYIKLVQKKLKKAQIFDNKIATNTVSQNQEIVDLNNKRKQSIHDAITISQSKYLTKQTIKEFRSKLKSALIATKRFKDLINEALLDDDSEDEPQQDFEADDEVMINVIKDIRKGDDAALTKRLEGSNNRTLAIQGENAQTNQKELAHQNVDYHNLASSSLPNIEGRRRNSNIQSNIQQFGKNNKNIQQSLQQFENRRLNINSQSGIEQFGSKNKNEQSEIHQNGGNNKNSQQKIQQTSSTNSDDQWKIQQSAQKKVSQVGANNFGSQSKVQQFIDKPHNKNKQSEVNQKNYNINGHLGSEKLTYGLREEETCKD